MGVLGRGLLLIGLIFVVVGVLFVLSDKIEGRSGIFHWLGRLPGDIRIEKENFRFYFPLTTSIIISLVLTLLFWLFGRR